MASLEEFNLIHIIRFRAKRDRSGFQFGFFTTTAAAASVFFFYYIIAMSVQLKIGFICVLPIVEFVCFSVILVPQLPVLSAVTLTNCFVALQQTLYFFHSCLLKPLEILCSMESLSAFPFPHRGIPPGLFVSVL